MDCHRLVFLSGSWLLLRCKKRFTLDQKRFLVQLLTGLETRFRPKCSHFNAVRGLRTHGQLSLLVRWLLIPPLAPHFRSDPLLQVKHDAEGSRKSEGQSTLEVGFSCAQRFRWKPRPCEAFPP